MTFLIIKGQDKIISVLPLCIFLSVLKYARIEYFNCSVIRYPAEIFINDLMKYRPVIGYRCKKQHTGTYFNSIIAKNFVDRFVTIVNNFCYFY